VAEVRIGAVSRVRDQHGGSQPGTGQFVERLERKQPLRAVMLGIGDAAAFPAADRIWRVSQLWGRNRRQDSGHEAVSEAAWTLTPIWQLPTLPSVRP
jgi:hypothetical protein